MRHPELPFRRSTLRNWGFRVVLFQALSGWLSWPLGFPFLAVPQGYTRGVDLKGVAQPWIYKTGTAFSRPDGYGKTNPFEDFATCVETYEKDGKGFYVFETVSENQDGQQTVRGTWTNIVRGA